MRPASARRPPFPRALASVVVLSSLAGCGAKTGLLTPAPHAVQVAIGASHTCALLSDGTVSCWGGNTRGQLGDGSFSDRVEPASVPDLHDIVQITASFGTTCARSREGAVYCWGDNDEGQVGRPSRETLVGGPAGFSAVPRPTRVDVPPVARVAAGSSHGCAVLMDGTVHCWGGNPYASFGFYSAEPWADVPPSETPGVRDVVAFDTETMQIALLRSGALVTWPTIWCSRCNQSGSGAAIFDSLEGLSDVVDVAAGEHALCALTRAGAVQCWGDPGYFPTLGNWNEGDFSHPWPVAGLDRGVVQLSYGIRTACVRMDDATVRCWGDNTRGQVGDGTSDNREVPATVAGVEGAVDVATYSSHSCAVLAGGVVRCWGDNDFGQLGDGTRQASPRPVTVRF